MCVLSSLFAASRRWSWVWGELRSNEIDESSSAKVSKIDPGGGGETVKPMEEGGAWPDLPKRVGGASWLVTTS